VTRDLFSAVQKFATEAYVNFMGEEDAGGVTEAYDEAKYAKLVALKKKYDPSNFFHLNQNISPSLSH
jgi:hypothetical protein